MMSEIEKDYPDFVEVDPSGRYARYNEVLGKGASKTVYRAFDEYEGIEVAWNQVKLHDFLQSPQDLERLYCEIHLLKTLKHKNIMKFYTSWVDTSKRNINFITEMFTSGTLRQYRHRYRRVNLRALKNWCRQILMGLAYLHSHDPPVIHRDLKCDNIFINGNHGEVKIGDLGLAAILRKSQPVHCVGTPEFMAPEVYEEEYNESVDIYSFGMCVLEMVTFDYPYSECTHPAQIYKKVISGTKPEALYRVKDPAVRQFVEKCLLPALQRLPAHELLNDPFLQIDGLDPVLNNGDIVEMGHILGHGQPFLTPIHSNGSFIANGFLNGLHNEHNSCLPLVSTLTNGFLITDDFSNKLRCVEQFDSQEKESFGNVNISIQGRREEDGGVFLRLRITDKDGHVRNIYFSFDVESDTAMDVAAEMVAELNITDYEVTGIAEMIDGELSTLVPGWKSGPDPAIDASGGVITSTKNLMEPRECEAQQLGGSGGILHPSPNLRDSEDDEKDIKLLRESLKPSKAGTMKSFHLANNCSYRVPHDDEIPDFETAFLRISKPKRRPEPARSVYHESIAPHPLLRAKSLPVETMDV